MINLKVGSCIEIEYEGKIEKTNQVFDRSESPVTIIVGANYVVKGLDESFLEHKVGDSYTIVVDSENGFGKRIGNLLKIIPLTTFRKHNINPFVGQTVNIDNAMGQVRSVSGGRVIVDFNHLLAGKNLEYKVKIVSEVKNDKKKVSSIISFRMKISDSHFKVSSADSKCIVEYKDNEQFFKAAKKILAKDIIEYTNYKTVEFKRVSKKK